MKIYDILLEEFCEKGGFIYELDIKVILNGFKFNSDMWEMFISELFGG